MEWLEQMILAPLELVEKYRQELKAVVEDEALPVNEMINRLNHTRKQLQQEGEGLFNAFDKEANELEQDLLQKLEQLREMKARSLTWTCLRITLLQKLEQLREMKARVAVVRPFIEAVFRPA